MSSYSSDDEPTLLSRGKLFDRRRPIHDLLGGGKGFLSFSYLNFSLQHL